MGCVLLNHAPRNPRLGLETMRLRGNLNGGIFGIRNVWVVGDGIEGIWVVNAICFVICRVMAFCRVLKTCIWGTLNIGIKPSLDNCAKRVVGF